MNLRCLYCQTPVTLSRVEMLSALVTMNEKNQNHDDAHGPRCRRANSISRQRMERFFPNWREAAKNRAAAAEEEPVAASASLKTEPLPKAAKKAAPKKPAAKKTAEKKPAAKKTTTAKKPASKPAAKTTSKTTKKK